MKRENLSKAIYDLGKVSFAVLVIGQIITDKSFNIWVFIGGLGFTVVSFAGAYFIEK